MAALINVPSSAKRGDVIEIKTLMSHIMETGFRHTVTGVAIPRNIITEFTCRYNGVEVFRADLFPAFSANPFITFLPWRQIVARLNFTGPAITVLPKPHRLI